MKLVSKNFRIALLLRWLAAVILGLTILPCFFYAVEDWRGAQAWATTKTEAEARGETFDYAHFIPPPVPDAQNLAAIPLFQTALGKLLYGRPSLDMPTLNSALRADQTRQLLPPLGSWQRGVLPDLAKFQTTIAANYTAAFKDAKTPATTLEQFETLYPFLENLRTKANTRPLCRFNLDYNEAAPILRSYHSLTQQILVSRILTTHAILALDAHEPDLALQDIQVNTRLLTAVKSDPSYIGGLVGIGMSAIGGGAIYDGLAHHTWTDAQLDQLERVLEPIDFLAGFHFANRCEAAMDATDVAFFKRSNHRETVALFDLWDSPTFESLHWLPWPTGWWDLNLSQLVAAHEAEMKAIDPAAHRVFPAVCHELDEQRSSEAARWDAKAPWNVWYTYAMDNSLNLTLKYAQAQMWIDETRITCGLERYRLAHGAYPATLDALVPACIDTLPRDMMNGEPYHYRVKAEGTFLLYSVGWNQTDDGGTIAHEKNTPKAIDYENGDWVWPTSN